MPTVSVIICAYTERRWSHLLRALDSVLKQSLPPDQVILVIDNNPALLARAQHTLSDVTVIPNSHTLGLSGARNSGISVATGEIVAFLDDDATASPEWLHTLVAPYRDPLIVGTGGAALPAWETTPPPWFPPEFYWVIGCSYAGLPTSTAPIRNPIGANMSFLRSVLNATHGFHSDVGRLGTLPLGCEETVLSIEVRKAFPGTVILYIPDAVVFHSVTRERTLPRYFLRRCLAEGISKATVTRHVGSEMGLMSERAYIRRTLIRGMFTKSILRSFWIAVGLATTALGYVLGLTNTDSLARILLNLLE